MPDLSLDRDTLEWVAVVAAAVAALSLLLVLFALARLRAVSRRVRRLTPGPKSAAEPGVDVRALRHVSVVRYDAFGDMGGALSFSAAIYDDQGDGLVISSINGRQETRTYAKALVGFQSEQTLSPEEQQAIDTARQI